MSYKPFTKMISATENVTKILTKTTGISKDNIIDYVGLIIATIILIIILAVLYNKLNLDNNNCINMNYQYKNMPLIKSLNENNDLFNYKLRDYYIKTAYNACCAGDFKNDFVNLCALKNCIKQGARCIDLEIYSLDDKPVIATSSVNDYTIKETYNSVLFSDAMDVISDYAFSGSTCPCPGDPLLIHLRIMSNNKKIYDEMAEILHNKLEKRLLGPEYSYENNQKNIGEEPLINFKGKIIIIVDKSNPLFENTLLDEYVNLSSNSIFMRKFRYSYEIKFAQDTSEIIEYNKKNMSICLPDLKSKPENYNVSIPMKYGCQMVALSFQNYDDNMKFYEKYFNGIGYSFSLKPDHLRHKPLTFTVPPRADKKLSYETKYVNKPYVSYKI